MDCLGRLGVGDQDGRRRGRGRPGGPGSDPRAGGVGARETFRAPDRRRPQHAPGAIGAMFELVRDVNTAIDAGELSAGRCAGGA